MDITSLLIAASSGMFVGLFFSLVSLCASLVCYRKQIVSSQQVRTLDQYISKHGRVQKTTMEPFSPPGDGLCLCIVDYGAVFAYRYTTVGERGMTKSGYELYIFGRWTLRTIESLLCGNARAVMITYVDQPTPYRTDINTTPYELRLEPCPWQLCAIELMIAEYEEKGRTSVLIWGHPGTGKTEIGMLVANALIKQGADPRVNIVDITSRGMAFTDAFGVPTAEHPAIIVLNEFDRTVEHARKEVEAKSDAMSIAHSKTTLMNCLDRIARIKHTILIVTTNSPPDVINTDVDGKTDTAFTRPGRFDHILHSEINEFTI